MMWEISPPCHVAVQFIAQL